MEEWELDALNKEYNETMLSVDMTLKAAKVISKKIVVSNEEIQEMMSYFQELEKYIICDRLKKLMK